MALELIYLILTRLVAWIRLLTRSETTNEVEILVLRHQLAVLQRNTAQTKPGRPAIPAGLRALTVRLAIENSTWGYRRIHGELARLGYQIGASTVWKILHTASIPPAGELDPRGPSSCALRHKRSWPATCSTPTPSPCAGSTRSS